MSALELTQSKPLGETSPIEYPDIIIEKIMHHLGLNQINPLNIMHINTTLGYSQQAVQAAASVLKGQHIYFVTEKVLALRSKMDIAFDTISKNTVALEGSLNPSVCIPHFGVLDVQNVLKVFVDLCVSSNFGEGIISSNDTTIFSTETIASSTYCLSSAIKTLLASAKVFTSSQIGDKNLLDGVQAVVESVLSITDIVMRGLKEMKGHEKIFNNPNLIQLSSAIGKLNSERFYLSNSAGDITSPFTVIATTTKASMENLPLIMDANIAILLKYVLTPQEEVPNFDGNAGPIQKFQSNLRELSQSVHSIYKSGDLTAYSVDTSSQNLIATISYLTNSVAALPGELIYIREFHELIEPNFQANLLFITSNIRTLGDEITLIVEQQLIDLICRSSSMDKTNLQKLKELENSIDTIIQIYEKVVRSSIETVRNHMYCVYAVINLHEFPKYDTDVQTLFRDTNELIGNLDAILSHKISTNSSVNVNAFTKCAKAFEEVALSPLKLRAFLTKSIEQIERYLL